MPSFNLGGERPVNIVSRGRQGPERQYRAVVAQLENRLSELSTEPRKSWSKS